MFLEQPYVRNLFSKVVKHPDYLYALETIEACRRNSKANGQNDGMTLQGPAGVGKSLVLVEYARMNPPQKYNGKTRVPVVLAKVSSSNSTTGLLRNILDAYGKPYSAGLREREYEHEKRVIEVMKAACTEVLLIDEAHNFMANRNRMATRTATSALKNIMTELNVTLVVAGTEDVDEFVRGNQELSSRMPMNVRLAPFDIETREQFANFRGVLSALESSISLPHTSRLHDVEIAQRIFYACDGRFRLLVKLLHKAVTIAIESGAKRISREDLYRAFLRQYGKDIKDAHNPFSDSFIPHRLVGPDEPFRRGGNGRD